MHETNLNYEMTVINYVLCCVMFMELCYYANYVIMQLCNYETNILLENKISKQEFLETSFKMILNYLI